MIYSVSFSELDTFRQCAHKHDLAYKNRWFSATTSPALARGTLFHACMENYYKAMRRVQREKLSKDEFPAYVQKKLAPLLFNENGSQSETQNLVEWMLD